MFSTDFTLHFAFLFTLPGDVCFFDCVNHFCDFFLSELTSQTPQMANGIVSMIACTLVENPFDFCGFFHTKGLLHDSVNLFSGFQSRPASRTVLILSQFSFLFTFPSNVCCSQCIDHCRHFSLGEMTL